MCAGDSRQWRERLNTGRAHRGGEHGHARSARLLGSTVGRHWGELLLPQPPAGDPHWEGHEPDDGAVYHCYQPQTDQFFYFWSQDTPAGSATTPREVAEIAIERLKDKLGTRKVPTAELTLDGTLAELVYGTTDGVKNITPVLNITRIWNSVSAVALMRRGIVLARDYARKRVAFGAPLAQKPLHLDTLAAQPGKDAGIRRSPAHHLGEDGGGILRQRGLDLDAHAPASLLFAPPCRRTARDARRLCRGTSSCWHLPSSRR